MKTLILLKCIICLSYFAYGQETKIILTSRKFYPANKQDSLSTIIKVKELQVEQVDWMYCDDPTRLDSLTRMGVPYSLAINPQLPDSAGFTTVGTRMIDRNGNPYVAPWMTKWKINNPYWGCVNNPAFQAKFLERTNQLVNLGAYGIFVDDSRFNDHAVAWGGGCFCNYCLVKFTEYLKGQGILGKNHVKIKAADIERNVDYIALYRRHQLLSVLEFLASWKFKVKTHANRPIAFITNNSGGKWSQIYQQFDTGIAEINNPRTAYAQVLASISQAKSLNKKQIFCFAFDDDIMNLSLYLYCYFRGYEALLPWDIFIAKNSIGMPSRKYLSNGHLIPLVKVVKKFRNQLSDSRDVDPATIGLNQGKNVEVVCRRLDDGTLLLLAFPKFSTPLAKVSLSIPATFLVEQVIPLQMYGSVVKSSALKNQLAGDIILVKLKS